MTITNPTTLRRLLTSASCVAWALVSGCTGGAGAEPDPTGPEPVCVRDADCPADQICRAQLCTVAEAPTQRRRLTFTFLPERSSGYLPQQTMPLEVEPGQRLDFLLEPGVAVTGEVSYAESARVLDRGTLIFERPREGGGRTRQQASIEQDGAFAVELLPGTYDITFVSGNPELPNRRWAGVTIGEAMTSLPLTLPASAQIMTVRGTLTHQDPALSAGVDAALPVRGARVVARARRGGTLTTAAVTDDEGNFSLNAWSDAGAHDLVVGPAEPNSLVPRYTQPSAFDTREGDVQTLPVSLGSWSSQRINLGVEFLELLLEESTSESPMDFDPQEARLTLRAELGEGELTLTHALGSSAPLEIHPLTYQVSLQPPPSSRFGELTFTWNAASQDAPGLEIAPLPRKRELRARLLRSDGAPASQARVDLMPLARGKGDLTGDGPDTDARLLSTVTDRDGYFQTWLEPSWSYEVTVIPAAGSGAPRGLFVQRPLEDDDDEGPADRAVERTLELPAPMALFGSVRDSELRGQPDLALELYEDIRGERRIVAQSRTDAEGSFRLVVPASLPPEDDSSE